MRSWFILVCSLWAAGLQAQGTRSLALDGATQYGTTTLLNQAPYNAVGSCRWEFRIHGFQTNVSTRQYVMVAGSVLVYILENSTHLQATDFLDPGSPTLVLDLAGRTDVLVRLQRDLGTQQVSFEMWNADQSAYVSAGPLPANANPANYSGPFYVGTNIGASLLKSSIAYLRWYSSAVNIGTSAPNNLAGGDLLRYEFENDTSDTSGHGQNLAMTGIATYASTPVYPPAANAGVAKTVRAGAPFTLDGSASSATAGDGTVAAYFWQQVAGPVPVRIRNRTSSSPTVDGEIAGTYSFRLTVTDQLGQTASSTVQIGAVATDLSGVVRMASTGHDTILSPLLRDGISPWPWFDSNAKTTGGLWGSQITPPPGSTPLAGTVSLSSGSNVVTGTGTTFQSTFACNGSDYIVVYYPVNGGTGHRELVVTACASDTQMTVDVAWNKAVVSGAVYGKASGTETANWVEKFNYYDQAWVQYMNYYRTGLDTYLNYAREMADHWCEFSQVNCIDTNYQQGTIAPRDASLGGVILRGLDGGPRYYLDFADQYVTAEWPVWIGARVGPPPVYWFGVRESAYLLLYACMLSQVHPDATVRAKELGFCNQGSVNYFAKLQYPDGSWRWTDPAWVGSAEQPFHVGILLEAMIAAHRINQDPTVGAAIVKGLDQLTANYRFVPARGQWYQIFGSTLAYQDCSAGCGATADSTVNIHEVRALNNTIIGAYGYAYVLTGNVAYRARGDELLAATFGNQQGLGADQYYGDSDAIWSDQKGYNQSYRSSHHYLAWRLNPQAGASLPLTVGFNLAAVAYAAQVRVTVTMPNGASTQTVCVTAPCSVSVDRSQGDSLVMLEYLSANGTVLAATKPARVSVWP